MRWDGGIQKWRQSWRARNSHLLAATGARDLCTRKAVIGIDMLSAVWTTKFHKALVVDGDVWYGASNSHATEILVIMLRASIRRWKTAHAHVLAVPKFSGCCNCSLHQSGVWCNRQNFHQTRSNCNLHLRGECCSLLNYPQIHSNWNPLLIVVLNSRSFGAMQRQLKIALSE